MTVIEHVSQDFHAANPVTTEDGIERAMEYLREQSTWAIIRSGAYEKTDK